MAELDDLFGDLEGFEWDAGNSDKHWVRHEVRQSEAEHALLNTPVVVKATTKHGSTEQRFVALGWRRPRLRVHPARPQVGLCTTGADEMWHIDPTAIRLLDRTRGYLHAVIDNFSRRILARRVADTFAPVNSVAVLLEASRGATRSANAPVVLAARKLKPDHSRERRHVRE